MEVIKIIIFTSKVYIFRGRRTGIAKYMYGCRNQRIRTYVESYNNTNTRIVYIFRRRAYSDRLVYIYARNCEFFYS